MINPKSRIYKAFKAVLDGIVYDGNTLDVVSFLGKGTTPLYIQMGNITTVEEGCIDLFGNECTIDIQIISQPFGNYTSLKAAEDVSDIVINRLQATTTGVIPVDDMDMVYLTLENGFTDSGLTPSERSYRVINQYRFLLLEIPYEADWILQTGFWNDLGVWKDSSTWID